MCKNNNIKIQIENDNKRYYKKLAKNANFLCEATKSAVFIENLIFSFKL